MLKEARVRRKLTQVELDQKIRAHKISISRLERGDRQPSMRMLQRLARALGVPLTALLE